MVATTPQQSWLMRWPGKMMWVALTLMGSAVSALLLARGQWLILLVLLVAAPGFLIIQRYPLAVMALWFVVVPFLTDVEDGGRVKLVYWAVHRTLPLAALIVLLVSHSTGTGYRRLGRLGWAEVAMLLYVVFSVVSILYTSFGVSEDIRHLYDRVVVPMILYVMVRLIRPSSEAMKKMSYILLFILLSQALIGLLSWVAPGVVPERFLTRLGQRTVGSLDHANVYGIVALAAGALFLHISRQVDDWRRKAGIPVFLLSIAMAILTFSRASWLAALVMVVGMAFVYPRLASKVAVVSACALAVFLLAGGGRVIGGYLEERFYSAESEESALSRLPVVFASLRMIESKPLAGWGYGNFDRYDYQFQSRVGELFVPEKDHASHNLFLTLGAEQGLLGFVTYIGAAVYWLFRTPRAMARLKPDGMFSRRLLFILWLIIAGHVIVTNFSNMMVSFGLAVWWLSLAMIGNLVSQSTVVDKTSPPAKASL